MIKDIHSNLNTKTKNLHCSYLSTDFPDINKKSKQDCFILNHNDKLSVKLIYNNKKSKKKTNK